MLACLRSNIKIRKKGWGAGYFKIEIRNDEMNLHLALPHRTVQFKLLCSKLFNA